MPSAKALIIQTAVIIGLGAAVGLGDLVYRGGKVQLGLAENKGALPPPSERQTAPPEPEERDPEPGDATTSSGDDESGPEAPDVTPVIPADTPTAQPQVASGPAYDCTSMEGPAHWDANHITVARAFDLFQSGQGVFVDARIEQDYLEGHIPGAHFLPVSAFDGDYPDRVKFQMDPNAITVVYCSGGDDCEAAEDVAIFLQGAGFTALYIIHDGMPGWIACGNPVEYGEDPNAF